MDWVAERESREEEKKNPSKGFRVRVFGFGVRDEVSNI